uniref:Sucrose synthase n=1 Tax=Rhizophora mucronata TaxID=61149 RepID=A0A2P2MD60_RHIMU
MVPQKRDKFKLWR